MPAHFKRERKISTKYTVSKGAPGKRKVEFGCPKCGDGLKAPLEAAGESVACPTCGHQQEIPGGPELEFQNSSVKAQREAQARTAATERSRQAAAEIHRKKAEADAEAAKDARRAEAERERQVRGGRPAIGTGLAFGVILLAAGLAIGWSVWVKPLKQSLEQTQKDLTALRDMVNANAKVANANTRALAGLSTDVVKIDRDLSSLTSTVNHNADVANRNNRRY